MRWRIQFTPRAERDLVLLTRGDREAIRRSLDLLIGGFGSVDLAKLSHGRDRWRLAVGERRAILHLDHEAGLISVVRILSYL